MPGLLALLSNRRPHIYFRNARQRRLVLVQLLSFVRREDIGFHLIETTVPGDLNRTVAPRISNVPVDTSEFAPLLPPVCIRLTVQEVRFS